MSSTRVNVPPNTRLQTIWRVIDPQTGLVTWEVWTACPDRNAPHHRMVGTFIALMPNGSAMRTTFNRSWDDEFQLLEPKGE